MKHAFTHPLLPNLIKQIRLCSDYLPGVTVWDLCAESSFKNSFHPQLIHLCFIKIFNDVCNFENWHYTSRHSLVPPPDVLNVDACQITVVTEICDTTTSTTQSFMSWQVRCSVFTSFSNEEHKDLRVINQNIYKMCLGLNCLLVRPGPDPLPASCSRRLTPLPFSSSSNSITSPSDVCQLIYVIRWWSTWLWSTQLGRSE